MYWKTLYFVLISYLIACYVVDAKKSRRIKRPKSEEDSTPQPSVVSYSTFGFNDVGAYEGFVPSSPDYASYLTSYNQDSTTSTRLYAPAFPTALDNYPSQDGATFNVDDNVPQASMLQFPQSSVSFMNTPSLDNEPQSQNNAPEIYGRNAGELGSPIYGTKLSSRGRNKPMSPYNSTADFNSFGSASGPSGNKFSSFHEVHSSFESKSPFGDSDKNYQFNYNYATTHPPTENEDVFKSAQSGAQNQLKFPKVIDFTKYKQYYPSEIENKFTKTTTSTTKPPNTYKPAVNIQENSYFNHFDDFSTKFPSTSFKDQFKDSFKDKDVDDEPQKEVSKQHQNIDFTQNYLNYPNSKNVFKDNKFGVDPKDKFKYDSWASTNYTNDFKTWKNPIKGYQYATNFSNMNFEFDFSESKKPANNNADEIVPASSNVVDLTSYQFPDTDYSSFKKIPGLKVQDSDNFGHFFDSVKPQGYKYDPEEYVKSIYSTVPTTTTLWGSMYKTPDFSAYKFRSKKPLFGDDGSDDVVHIGNTNKRPYSNKYSSYGKFTESKPTEWSSYNSHRPYKSKKPSGDWPRDVSTRFKSEEDLLGLRTHDTSHPSYLPTYRPDVNSLVSEYDYKKLAEKWRQSYLKAKYKDAGVHDFESYASDTKPVHVPLPKPYPIEVPHPVIVPVPQPYPVRVPMPKPVAVPVIREIKVPVEKPVPYAVYKNVPYPVEKPVPVPVEKEVQVPVVKPYPVPIPHIRPVFHHTRPREDDSEDEDDYMPRPEPSKKVTYSKRPRSTRYRSRRPSRPHSERNRRRWPSRRPSDPRRRPSDLPSSYKHFETEFDDFEHSHSEYIMHCKRTGNC